MAKAQQDSFQRAKERIDEAKDHYRDEHERIREDLRFSNPANPEQWRNDDMLLRNGRPSLTLDRTNQFISQVSNDMRQNKPGIQVIAVDDKADPKTAETLGGIIRHIEYRSRAQHAYDTAGDLIARCGRGWLRVIPEVVDATTNEQEIRILRVTDPNACGLDPNSTEADGADAMWGYAETLMSDRAFKAAYPKAKPVPFGDAGWYSDGMITVCEYFEIQEQSENRIIAVTPDGLRNTYTEDDYWALAQSLGVNPHVLGTVQGKKRTVKWQKMSGAEVLEETVFPSQFLPIIPVIGYELWVDGKRFVCGLTRRLMDGQRLHNFQMSAMAEFLASQPKAPFLVPFEGLDGFENDWKKLNKGNPGYLPYNAFDESGNAIPAPSRLSPPPMPGAYAQMAQFAVSEMEASVGMYKANLGQQGNETSGRAIRARQMEGDTATFHFIDNLSRSIEQLGRVVVDMIPRIYDTTRIKQIIGINDERQMVKINPDLPQAAKLDAKGKVVEINPNVGKYDVRVKAGPSYTTQREETVQQLTDMMQAQPQLAPVLGPMWARLKDMPESDKIAKLLLAMAPPQVQAMESDEQDMPPAALAKIQHLEQQLQEANQVMQQAAQRLDELQAEDKKLTYEYLVKAAQIQNDEYGKETERLKVLGPAIDPQQLALMSAQLVLQALNREPMQDGEEIENAVQQSAHMQDEPHHQLMQMEPPEIGEPPEIQDDQTTQGPSGPFSLPEQEAEQ